MGCAPAQNKDAEVIPAGGQSARGMVNKPIDTYRLQLLDLAFSGVSEMPLKPHIKNRSRAQLKVVEAALELDQVALAAGYVEQIENWRRWMGNADLAVYFAENNSDELFKTYDRKVERALEAASELHNGRVVVATENPLLDQLEDWRYEAVLTRMMEGRLINESLEDSFSASEETYGELNAATLNVSAMIRQEKDFGVKVALLRELAQSQDFKIIYFAFSQMADVVAEEYGTLDLKTLVETEVAPKLVKVPVFLRLNLYHQFADAAVENHDSVTADFFLKELTGMVDALASDLRYYVPESVRLIRLRLKMGVPKEELVEKVQGLLQSYQAKRTDMDNIDRAGVLCQIAEAYHFLGTSSDALTVYALAIDEGQVNPNSRPQADDLSRICLSMALNGVVPSKTLWKSLQEMRSGLGAPW